MARDPLADASKRLSWLLRHGAREAGLAMDAAGWAAIDDVLALTPIDRATLEQVVATSDKGRLAIAGARIRAVQGHSLAGTPVTLDALEASWTVVTDDAPIFHGTRLAVLGPIERDGLVPGARTHVHLAESPDARAGKRAQVDVLLEVAPAALRAAGIALHRAPNGVVLARRVPPVCIRRLHPRTRRAARDLPLLPWFQRLEGEVRGPSG